MAFGAIGFRAGERGPDQRGPSGRNVLHSCIQEGRRDVRTLLERADLQAAMPTLLRQRDADGATPFFSAMAKVRWRGLNLNCFAANRFTLVSESRPKLL